MNHFYEQHFQKTAYLLLSVLIKTDKQKNLTQNESFICQLVFCARNHEQKTHTDLQR